MRHGLIRFTDYHNLNFAISVFLCLFIDEEMKGKFIIGPFIISDKKNNYENNFKDCKNTVSVNFILVGEILLNLHTVHTAVNLFVKENYMLN